MNSLAFLEVRIAVAWVLDLLMGDPPWLPHPVRFMGWLALRLKDFYSALFSRARLAGTATALTLPIAVYLAARALLQHSGPWAYVIEILLIYTALATHSLYAESRAVLGALEEGDVERARLALSRIVGRDTESLDEREIVRALVETVAENVSDGIVAPLFYAFLGGAPLALAYKAVNTLDSMFGYRDEKLLHFGWASAKIDDGASYLPARLTGALMVAAAWLTGMDARSAWAVMVRDGGKHPSPNSGVPEAAAAGALGVQLGGMSTYFGKPSPKELIGEGTRAPEREDVTRVHRLMLAVSLLATALPAAVLLAARALAGERSG